MQFFANYIKQKKFKATAYYVSTINVCTVKPQCLIKKSKSCHGFHHRRVCENEKQQVFFSAMVAEPLKRLH